MPRGSIETSRGPTVSAPVGQMPSSLWGILPVVAAESRKHPLEPPLPEEAKGHAHGRHAAQNQLEQHASATRIKVRMRWLLPQRHHETCSHYTETPRVDMHGRILPVCNKNVASMMH